MSIQVSEAISVDGVRRNGNCNQTLNRPVSLDTAFDRALRSGLHVSDGSLYEAEPATAEPTIELIEEVGPKDLPFDAPEGSTHVRVTYTEGSDRYVSFSPRTYTECDDYREFLVAELGRAFVDGVEVPVWQDDEPLAEALEEWVLGRRGE
jgi:hypothetical protein